MAGKKIYTRKEFEEFKKKSAARMAKDKSVRGEAFKLLKKADKYNYLHQAVWLGEPLLNLPEDMFALQELIFKTKPKYIIESGVAWGGSLLFFSTLMEIIGGGEKVIGLDIFIPNDLKKRLNSHGKISKRLELIEGSSIDLKTVSKVKSIVGNSKEVMVVLDSHHTHDHVLQELNLYSPFVGKGYYIICGDTIIEYISKPGHRPRPWGIGNNPKTALNEFLKHNKRFKIDRETDNKLLLTCNPDGFLKCCKD